MDGERSRQCMRVQLEYGAGEYADVIVTLVECGLPTQFTQTGGMNAALEVQLETGAHLLITDAEDSLAWRRCEQRGWGVGLYRGAESDDGPDYFASTPNTGLDALLKVLQQVLTAPAGASRLPQPVAITSCAPSA